MKGNIMGDEVRDYDEELDGDGLSRQVSMYSYPPLGVKVLVHRSNNSGDPLLTSRESRHYSAWSVRDFDRFTGWTFTPEKPEVPKSYVNELDCDGWFMVDSNISPEEVRENPIWANRLIDFLKDSLDGH